MNKLILASNIMVLLTMVSTSILQVNAQSITSVCPVFQQDYATGSCNQQSKTEYSLIKAYCSGGERGWAKFDVSSIPDSVTITEIKIHYYIDNQTHPYYLLTKLTQDPVSSSASTLYSQIGLASNYSPYNSNTYFHYDGLPVNGWNVKTLYTPALSDLQNQLPYDWFGVGFWEYENSGNYYLQCHGWYETNEPYIEVTYMPQMAAADLGIPSIVLPAFPACADTIPVKILLTNYGTNTVTSAQITWTINNNIQPTYQWTKPGGLAPGSTDTVELGSYYFTAGYYHINASVSLLNGLVDVNPANNSKTIYFYVIGDISFTDQPENDTVVVGATADFWCFPQGYVTSLQWQVSIDSGQTFNNIQSNPPYINADSNHLSLQNVNMSQNGLWFRCLVSGYCNQVYTNQAQLLVFEDSLSIHQISVNPTSICQGGIAYLHVQATGGTGVYTYSWTSYPPGFTSTLQNTIVTPAQTTQYTCVVSDSINSVSGSCTVNVMPLPGAAGAIQGPGYICQGSVVTFTVPSIPNATSYNWTFPPGATGNTNTPNNVVTVTFSSNAQSGNLTVKGVNNCGFGPSSTLFIGVQPLPTAAQSITGPSVVCKNTNGVVYTCQPPILYATDIVWVCSGVFAISSFQGNQVTVDFGPGATSGYLSVNGYNSCGEGPVTSLYITVANQPVVSAGPDQTIAPGDSVTLVPSVTSGQPPYAFVWSNGTTTASNTVSPLITTTYTVTVTDSNGCYSHDQVVVHVQAVSNITTIIPAVNHCTGEILVPVYVHNFYGVASVSLSLVFDTNHLVFSGYQNINPLLSTGTLVINSTSNTINLAWFSLVPVNIGNSLLISLKFIADTGFSTLNWDLLTQGACQYTDLNNITIPATFTNGTVLIEECSDYSGYVRYHNLLNTPVPFTTINLLQGTSVMYTTTTDATGFFEFEDLIPGTYTTEVLPTLTWGGVNAADALMTLKHFVGMDSIQGLALQAGDVDNNNSVNAVDALLDVKRFVHMIDSFAIGDWTDEVHTFTINGSGNVYDSIPVLCSGDVDASFIPGAKLAPAILLDTRETATVRPDHTLLLPFKVTKDLEIGSVSCVLHLTEGWLELIDIQVSDKGNLLFSQQGDEIRFAWFSIDPRLLKAGEALFTMECRVNPSHPLLGFTAGIESQVTDIHGMTLPEVTLTYPAPTFSGESMTLGQNRPNPCENFTEIPYDLPETGQVRLVLFDANGKELRRIINQEQTEGNHVIGLSTRDLQTGLYFYRLEMTTSKAFYSETKKLLVK